MKTNKLTKLEDKVCPQLEITNEECIIASELVIAYCNKVYGELNDTGHLSNKELESELYNNDQYFWEYFAKGVSQNKIEFGFLLLWRYTGIEQLAHLDEGFFWNVIYRIDPYNTDYYYLSTYPTDRLNQSLAFAETIEDKVSIIEEFEQHMCYESSH